MKEKNKVHITRRSFLKSTGGALAMASLGAGPLLDSAAQTKAAGSSAASSKGEIMQKRVLGKTREQLSIVGFGGIVVCNTEQSEANARVREAIDRGINYFDVAPSYCKGEAEERLGPALEETSRPSVLRPTWWPWV